jgi:hypothetical protein
MTEARLDAGVYREAIVDGLGRCLNVVNVRRHPLYPWGCV